MWTLVCIQDGASDAKTELSAKGSPFEDDEVAEDGEGETQLAPVSFRQTPCRRTFEQLIEHFIKHSIVHSIEPRGEDAVHATADVVFLVVIAVFSLMLLP